MEETPLVSCQFAWNELYKYKACEFCLRSLETAEAMAQRLTENPSLILLQPDCCDVKLDQIVTCPQCGVGIQSFNSVLQSYPILCLSTFNLSLKILHFKFCHFDILLSHWL